MKTYRSIFPLSKKLNLLSIYFLIAAIILSGILILVGYFYVKALIFESNRYRLQFEVREVLDDIENTMDNAARFTKDLALDFNEVHMRRDPSEIMSFLFQAQPATYEFGMVHSAISYRFRNKLDFTFVRSQSGSIRSDIGRYSSHNEKINEWIIQMVNNSIPEWSVPFYNPEIRSRVMIYAYPFDYLLDGKSMHATFFCSVALDNVLKNLKKQSLISSALTFLLNEKNQIVYHPDSTETGKNLNSLVDYFSRYQCDISKLLSDRISGLQIISPKKQKNKPEVAIYWPVKSSHWFIIILVPEHLFMSELKRTTLIVIPLILFIGSVIALLTIYNSIKLFSPISFLANDSRRILADSAFERDNDSCETIVRTDRKTMWRLTKRYPLSPLDNIEVLSSNMEKIKERLASYRENTLQSSLNQEAMEKELILARDIEMGMVPTNFPLIPGRNDFDCFGRLIPAKIVGGDLFDIFLLNDNQLFISITDTLGKGIPAAMYSVMTRTFIRSIANPITRLGKIMESLNEALSLLRDSDMFATVFLGKLDLNTGEFNYCNAGHPHPIILRNNHHEELLANSHGIPLGVKRDLKFSESITVLAPGESVITFTDGITEQSNEKGEFFGTERLISVVNSFYNLPAQEIVDKTIDILEYFKGNNEVHDDITLAALKYLG